MKTKLAGAVWGFVLVLAGGLFLARNFNYIHLDLKSTPLWIGIFAVASALFLVTYFLLGVRQWGWLFPASLSAGLAIPLILERFGVDGSALGAPILGSTAVPFLVAFALNKRRHWWALIIAWVMMVLTLITLLADRVSGNIIGALFMFSSAAPFLFVFLVNRSRRWWALIIGWVMTVLALITLLADRVSGNVISALFLYSVAAPFLVVFLVNRSRRWALIPACALAVIGTVPLLAMASDGRFTAITVMFLFALPFFVIYFSSKPNWWALIPAGTFASIGLTVLLSWWIPDVPGPYNGTLSGVLLLGLGFSFGVLWLRRVVQPTDWAKYPAAGLLASGLMSVILGNDFINYWPLVVIAVGIALVISSLIARRPVAQATTQHQA